MNTLPAFLTVRAGNYSQVRLRPVQNRCSHACSMFTSANLPIGSVLRRSSTISVIWWNADTSRIGGRYGRGAAGDRLWPELFAEECDRRSPSRIRAAAAGSPRTWRAPCWWARTSASKSISGFSASLRGRCPRRPWDALTQRGPMNPRSKRQGCGKCVKSCRGNDHHSKGYYLDNNYIENNTIYYRSVWNS